MDTNFPNRKQKYVAKTTSPIYHDIKKLNSTSKKAIK